MLAMPEQSFAVESGWQAPNEAGFTRHQVHAHVVVVVVAAAVVVIDDVDVNIVIAVVIMKIVFQAVYSKEKNYAIYVKYSIVH